MMLPSLNKADLTGSPSLPTQPTSPVFIVTYSPTDDTSANQLTITSYDSTTSVMTGTFRTTVVVDSAQRVSEPGEPPRRRPDTLRFTDGEFRVRVEVRQ